MQFGACPTSSALPRRFAFVIAKTDTLTYLEYKECVKYLGALIYYELSWKNHVDSTALKISKTIGLLSKLRHFVPHHTLRHIYNPLVLLICVTV